MTVPISTTAVPICTTARKRQKSGAGDADREETNRAAVHPGAAGHRAEAARRRRCWREVDQDVAAAGAAALVWICLAVSDLRRLLEGNLDPRPLGTVSERQAVIGVRIEKGP